MSIAYGKKTCLTCTIEFDYTYRERSKKFCSPLCYWNSKIGKPSKRKGFKANQKTIEKLRNSHIGQKAWNKGLTGVTQAWNKGLPSEKQPRWLGGISKYPEYWSIVSNRRRTRKNIGGGTFSVEEWINLKKKFNYMCLCCKRFEPEIKLTADHVIPLYYGGSNKIGNIQPLCKSCNSIKHTKSIDYRLTIKNNESTI